MRPSESQPGGFVSPSAANWAQATAWGCASAGRARWAQRIGRLMGRYRGYGLTSLSAKLRGGCKLGEFIQIDIAAGNDGGHLARSRASR
jgi:hypothetical protein